MASHPLPGAPLAAVLGATLIAALSASPPAGAATVTRNTAGSVTVQSGSWFMPDLASVHDMLCAADLASGSLVLTGYGFSLPSDAVISGVSVAVWATSPIGSANVNLVYNGGSSGTHALTVVAGTCGSLHADSGGPADDWGLALTPALVNDAAFGVQVTGAGDNISTPFRLDGVPITLTYTQAPGAPTGLAAVSAVNEVTVTWADNASDETSFSVERRSEPSGAFAEIGTTGANVTTFHDTTAACDATYSYQVRAFRSSDSTYSGYSNVAAATRLCPDLTVSKSATATQVLVGAPWTWTLVVTNGGSGPAVFTPGQAIVADTLPGSPVTYSNVVGGVGGGTSGSPSCALAAGVLRCAATTTVTIPSGGTATVSVDGSSNAEGDFANGGNDCAADPDDVLVESVENDDACNLSTVSVRVTGIFADGFEGGVLPGPWNGGSTP